MIYYSNDMELEVVSQLLHGSVNDVVVCQNRLSASGALYTLLVIHDRECARKMLQVMQESQQQEVPYLAQFSQNETLIFVFPYRENRKFSAFAKGQNISPEIGENICVNLVMECLSTHLPWPLLYLVLDQNGIQITKENSIYFTLELDLSELKVERTQRDCVVICAQRLMELLSDFLPEHKRKKQLKSLELVQKKCAKNAYDSFPELYQDLKLTRLPPKKVSLKNKIKGMWMRNRDILFRLLLVLCCVLMFIALTSLISQVFYGEVIWIRLFQNSFDVIGTEDLHRGGLK